MNINRFRKAIAVATSLVVGLSLAGSAMALTSADISMLQAAGIINASQAASLLASIGGSSAVTGDYVFTSNMTVGSKGVAVTALQQVLVNQGYLVMPTGVPMGYFGALTRAAVIKFQLAKGIAPAVGYVGSITRGVLNGMATGGNGTVVYANGTDLKVSRAVTSPASGAIIAGQAAADLAEYTFTNTSNVPAVVTNVTLMRGGVSADASLANVYLYQGAVRITDGATVSSGKITFNAGTGLFTVPAGYSITIAVRSDIDTSASAGSIINVSLTGVTSNVPVSAVYPITGASMSVATVTDLASATSTLTSLSNGGDIQAGSMNQTVWSTYLSVSGRSVWLKSLAVKVIGSIPSDALQNLTLYVSGTQVAKALGVDANGMVTFDLSAAPYKIDSARTIEVRTDVVKGSSRTFIVSLQNASDLQIVDSNYNVGITVGLSGTQNSGTWTVNGTTGGTVVVTTDSSLSSGDVITGATNVPLARYTLKAYGEDIKISQLNATTTHVGGLQNAALYANGVQVGSTQTLANGGAAKLFNLGSSLILVAGQSVTLELRADIKNADGTNATTTGGGEVFTSEIDGVAGNAQGRDSSALSTTTGAFGTAGPTMTVKAAGVTLAKNTSYQDQSTLPNQAFKIGSYTVQTTSAEGITLSGLTVTLNGADAGAYTNLSNLYVVSGSYTSSSVNPSSSNVNNFTLSNFTVAANSSRTIDIYANLGASTSGLASTSLTISGYGINSNTLVSKTAVGQTISLGSGSVAAPTLKAGSFTVTPRFVVGGSSFVNGTLNFISSNGTSYINELTFTNEASGTSASGIVSVTVGGVTANMSAGTSTITGLNIPVAIAPGTNVPVTVAYNNVAYTNGVPSNETAGLELTGFKFTSGNSQTSTTTIAVDTNLMTLLNSAPRVTLPNSSATLSGGNQKLASITVAVDSQDPAGQITLLTLPISITTTGTATAQDSGSMTVKVNGTDLVSNGQATVDALSSSSITTTAGTATTTIHFVGGYDIPKGTSVTFDFYDTADGGATAGSVSTRLGGSSLVTFNDTIGSSTAVVTGSQIYNYSTTDNSTLTF